MVNPLVTPEQTGDGKLASQIRDLRKEIRSQVIRPGWGLKAIRTSMGTTIAATKGKGGGGDSTGPAYYA
jgi:hypothetical protein